MKEFPPETIRGKKYIPIIKDKSLANAVCIIIEDFDDNVLTVTRRNTDILCLPGGKQDPGETLLDSIVREVREETGFAINSELCVPIYAEIVLGNDGHDFYCQTYLYKPKINSKIYRESWVTEPGITVSFQPWHKLLTRGTFMEYNARVELNVTRARKHISGV